jgi:hypothetical protein
VREILQGWTELESVRTWGRCAFCRRFCKPTPDCPSLAPQTASPSPSSSSLLPPKRKTMHNADVVLPILIILQVALRKGWGQHRSGEATDPIDCLNLLFSPFTSHGPALQPHSPIHTHWSLNGAPSPPPQLAPCNISRNALDRVTGAKGETSHPRNCNLIAVPRALCKRSLRTRARRSRCRRLPWTRTFSSKRALCTCSSASCTLTR